VFIKTEPGGKRNGEKISRLDNFAVHSLTIFQLNCNFWGERVIHGITAHRPIFVTLPLLPSEFIKTEQGGKKNGEKRSRISNFSVL
jgi:hypothetical protein